MPSTISACIAAPRSPSAACTATSSSAPITALLRRRCMHVHSPARGADPGAGAGAHDRASLHRAATASCGWRSRLRPLRLRASWPAGRSRSAGGGALRARRWEAMVSVGDAAVKIDATASRVTGGQPTGFRAEARKVLSPRAFRRARRPRGPRDGGAGADHDGGPAMTRRARTFALGLGFYGVVPASLAACSWCGASSTVSAPQCSPSSPRPSSACTPASWRSSGSLLGIMASSPTHSGRPFRVVRSTRLEPHVEAQAGHHGGVRVLEPTGRRQGSSSAPNR